MSDRPSDELLARLDDVVSTTPAQVGIGMGIELFIEMWKRGLITMQEFSALGTGFLPHRLPAYRKRNFAFVHTELDDWDFKIGGR